MRIVCCRRWLSILVSAGVCWSAVGVPVATADPSGTTIIIRDFMYVPMAVTVSTGTRVTWINKDDEPHNVISDTGLFRSGAIDTDETFTYQFNQPGVYRITCSIHPRMLATVTVEQRR